MATIKSKKNYYKKLRIQLIMYIVSVTEFNTKILEAFVKIEESFFYANSEVPCEECLYKL